VSIARASDVPELHLTGVQLLGRLRAFGLADRLCVLGRKCDLRVWFFARLPTHPQDIRGIYSGNDAALAGYDARITHHHSGYARH
jgi:hypothetical protein